MKKYKFKINDDKYSAKILKYTGELVRVEVNGVEYEVEIQQEKLDHPKLIRSQKSSPEISISASKPKQQFTKGALLAPIPGLVVKINVSEGDVVKSGDTVMILEAMKMESEINAEKDGSVQKILVKEGDNIEEGQALIEIGD